MAPFKSTYTIDSYDYAQGTVPTCLNNVPKVNNILSGADLVRNLA